MKTESITSQLWVTAFPVDSAPRRVSENSRRPLHTRCYCRLVFKPDRGLPGRVAAYASPRCWSTVENLNLEGQDDGNDYTVGIKLVGVVTEPVESDRDRGLAVVDMVVSNAATESAIRSSYGILVEDKTVQALSRENFPSQVDGTDAFKNKGFGVIIAAARQSSEVYEAITADPDHLDAFFEAMFYFLFSTVIKSRDDSTNPPLLQERLTRTLREYRTFEL